VNVEFFRDTTEVDGVHLVVLQGELDMASAKGLADWLADIAGSPVVVDLSGLTFMDSSGISALLEAKKRMAGDGNELFLTRPTAMVKRTLEIVGLADWVSDWNHLGQDLASGS
jgi:anti-sigma B factor antagonist